MYRWAIDQWAFHDKPNVIADFNGAVAHGYSVPPGGTEPPQENGMLNPSLELPYYRDPTHSTVNVAHDWKWFASDGKPPEREGPCQLPEYKSISRNEDSRRVFDGDTAQCWFIRWKIFDAGIYQTVNVPSGSLCTPDIAAQAWCSDSDDPTVSDGDMHLMLGIDPTGRTDAFSGRVQWSTWMRVDSQYRRFIGPIVEAEASVVTFFVRAWNKWELSHNDIYVDDAHLVVEGSGPPPGGEVDYEYIRQIVREELDKSHLSAT
jgi:hypothetical protein